MLNRDSPTYLHFLQNVSLIVLSLCLLPLDTYVLICTYVLQILLLPQRHASRMRMHALNRNVRPKTILVTGVGMSKGLALARMFSRAGHTVIGADFEPNGVPVCGRFSTSLKRFYRLTKPNAQDGAAFYIQELVRIIHRERCDLWVTCSGVASAVEDGQAKEVVEKRTDCACVQYDAVTTAMLHEKSSFIGHTRSIGLPVPETHDVTSRSAVHKVLDYAPKRNKQYIMKSVGMDDAARGNAMQLLPRRTLSQTYTHVSKIDVSRSNPYVLQAFVKGKEYCTHALVVRGQVEVFVSCPSAELLMHYEALHSESALNQAMLKFTQEFVARSGGNWIGHLSFDFLVEERATEKGLEQLLFAIECNPRAHTAVLLFSGLDLEMAQSYTKAAAPAQVNGLKANNPSIVIPKQPAKYYWVGHDLVELVVLPLLQLFMLRLPPRQFLQSAGTFLSHLLFWKDGTFEIWDPLPWYMLYHVYWPGMFLAVIWNRKWWSRINVSTTKMFMV